jgi:hypothetical protein
LLGLPACFTPDDFDIQSNTQTPKEITDLLLAAKLTFSLAYIANVAEASHEELIRYKFNGYKTFTTENSKAENLGEDHNLAFKIYSWIYEDGKCSDKLGLARNILTLNTNENRLNLSNTTWLTIQSNYEIYLKDNIHQYLNLKSNLLEFISDFSKKSLELTDSFTSSFQSNTIAFISFIVTVVAINGIKDSGSEKIFSIEYLLISALICIISFIWLLITRSDTHNRIKYFSNQTNNSIQRIYKNIISEEELNQTIAPTITEIQIYANKRIFRFTALWAVTTLVFISLFCVGHLFTKPSLPSNKSSISDPVQTPPHENKTQPAAKPPATNFKGSK